MTPAEPADWDTEFLDKILAVAVGESIDEASDHITWHGSGHTDAIVTSDLAAAQRFVNEIDSSAVMVNASTRFNDGGQLGLGAEIGISTDKIHARGPCGLKELTSTKWIVVGEGHVRLPSRAGGSTGARLSRGGWERVVRRRSHSSAPPVRSRPWPADQLDGFSGIPGGIAGERAAISTRRRKSNSLVGESRSVIQTRSAAAGEVVRGVRIDYDHRSCRRPWPSVGFCKQFDE
jgi:hypothetical protein